MMFEVNFRQSRYYGQMKRTLYRVKSRVFHSTRTYAGDVWARAGHATKEGQAATYQGWG
jgi:hypothetical protein